MGAGLIAHSALTPSVMDGKSHLFHNLMLLLRAICQYAQFAKVCCAIWKLCMHDLQISGLNLTLTRLNPDTNPRQTVQYVLQIVQTHKY